MIAEMGVSFRSLTDSEVFTSFMKEELGWIVPSRDSMRRLLPRYYELVMKNLRAELAETPSISITTDSTFLTRHQVPYICISGHWIDAQWKLHDKTLAVFLAEQSETADFITARLRDILQVQFSLGRKVHCVVTDEGRNFLSAAEHLRDAEVVRESLRCTCHRFQLTIKNAVMHKDCVELLELLEKCQALTLVFKNGWASTKRDVLRKEQQRYVDRLAEELARQEKDIGTRAALEAAAEMQQKLDDA
jgi:hypothetical protein